MTRDEVQPAWEKIVDIGYSSYEQLTREQRVWFNIEPLTTDGIIDHYINTGAERNLDTIQDLTFLGFSDIADALRRINSFFRLGEPPGDIDERNEEIVSWDKQRQQVLDEIDRQFWTECKRLEKALIDFINRTGIGNN